jgi:hypothetical protein
MAYESCSNRSHLEHTGRKEKDIVGVALAQFPYLAVLKILRRPFDRLMAGRGQLMIAWREEVKNLSPSPGFFQRVPAILCVFTVKKI